MAMTRSAACAAERRRRLATRRQVCVGTNRYADPAESASERRGIDHEALRTRRAGQVVKQRAAGTAQEGVLDELTGVLEADLADLFTHMETAADHGATRAEPGQ